MAESEAMSESLPRDDKRGEDTPLISAERIKKLRDLTDMPMAIEFRAICDMALASIRSPALHSGEEPWAWAVIQSRGETDYTVHANKDEAEHDAEGEKEIVPLFAPSAASTTPRSGETPTTDAALDGWADDIVRQSRLIPADAYAKVRDTARQLERTLAGVREVLRQSDAENDELRSELAEAKEERDDAVTEGVRLERQLTAALETTASATRCNTDTERMEWLARFVVEVRQPMVHGSLHLFTAAPVEVEGCADEPSNIRQHIDYQRKGGDKPADAAANLRRADGGKACSCGATAGQYHAAGCGYEGVFNG